MNKRNLSINPNNELTEEEVQFTTYSNCGETRYTCMNDCILGSCFLTCAE